MLNLIAMQMSLLLLFELIEWIAVVLGEQKMVFFLGAKRLNTQLIKTLFFINYNFGK